MGKIKILLILCLLATVFTVFAGELGDANDDGVISIVDALVVAQYYVGIENLPIVTENCDVNADGTLDIVDALLIAQYVVGLIDTFPGAVSPDGILVGTTGCKYQGATGGEDSGTGLVEPADVSASEECLQYQYDPDLQVLYLRHVNGAFNCCSEPQLEVMEISTGYIRIISNEGLGPFCDCYCLFDLDYAITDLPPGVYMISVKSSLSYPEVMVNLTTEPAGIFCFPRGMYPWG